MKRKSVISLVLVGLLACLVGCNSNPVAATSGSDTLLGYSQSGRLAEENSVDILWVIDNSGSMGDEQVALINEVQKFVFQMTNANIDFQMGVTSTEAIGTNGGGLSQIKKVVKDEHKKDKFIRYTPGELRTVPNPVPGTLAWQTFSEDPATRKRYKGEKLNKAKAAAIKSFTETALNAWKCTVGGEQYDEETSERTKREELKDKVTKIVDAALATPEGVPDFKPSATNDAFPMPDQYEVFPSVIKSSDPRFIDSATGQLDQAKIVRAFKCIAMVGTEGSGIEKGLNATIDATRNDNGLIRQLSKFAVVYVSDENDCSHRATNGKDFDDQGCGALLCNLFNADKIPNNPMIPVEEVKSMLMRNLKAKKTQAPNFDEDSVIVAAITGHPVREKLGDGDIGFTKTIEAITRDFLDNNNSDFKNPACEGIPFFGRDANNQAFLPKANTCEKKGGLPGYSAMNGDRYNRFADLFKNHFPKSGGGEDGGEGVICYGTFGKALDAIAKLLAAGSSGCITQKLLGADECSGPDVEAGVTPCGVEGQGGKCMGVVGGKKQFYCSSALNIVAESLEPLAQKFVEDFCQDQVSGNVSGMTNACFLSTSRYEFVKCPAGAEGVKFQIKNLAKVKDEIDGVNIRVFYTAYAPEDEEADATGTNQTQK